MLELANKVLIRVKSNKTKKYLRLNKQGGTDATAGKSPDSVFMVHRIDANHIKLQSAENPDKWLQCTSDGEINENGKGGQSCIFMLKHHERDVVSLSPKQNIDWHVGVDQSGKMLNSSQVPHCMECLFIIELVNSQILMPGRV
uniref:Fibroblast growth factor domain-containing protein n=1 Tax=Trepomonas sp. PC1 TaxID=1076344 RepID=A0A146KAT0_9EUKA|eukprot:JAP92626.1 Fibroblast growth factor domain-containing protein [Trepomonas sp. PC1]